VYIWMNEMRIEEFVLNFVDKEEEDLNDSPNQMRGNLAWIVSHS
jgi:hypothetical protein